jgi:predicted nucleotidyltransferase
MAQLDALIERKAHTALAVVSRLGRVVRAYLFGSQIEGTADRWSDIDLAVFVEGLEAWNLHDRARVSAQVQKEAATTWRCISCLLRRLKSMILPGSPPGSWRMASKWRCEYAQAARRNPVSRGCHWGVD